MKQVIVLRKDLNMRKGKMAAQAAHASVSVVVGILPFITIPKHVDGERFKAWYSAGQKKIALGVDTEEMLDTIVKEAHAAGLPCALIIDAGHTEFNGKPTKTCVAIGPAEDEAIDKITGKETGRTSLL